MGIYINPGNEGFRTARNGIYVDKSSLVGVINGTIDTPKKLSCISRPRRFGKSYAAKMLSAYYDRSCDSAALFDDLAIAKDSSYRTHLNRYNVLFLDITNIIGEAEGRDDIVPFIKRHVCTEVHKLMPEIEVTDSISVMLGKMVERTGGTGYAGIVYLPKKNGGLPALVIELKWNESAEGAIVQIKSRNYPAVLEGFGEEILLVGISYGRDDKAKKYRCRIERVQLPSLQM